MSLLQNDDFIIYQLRSGYLSNIKDGVGERLITLTPSVFNTPAFRAAGWEPSPDIQRTYSPPIPTAVASEYFQNPRPRRISPTKPRFDQSDKSIFESGKGNDLGDPFGTDLNLPRSKRQHRFDDDSSDDSDESEDDGEMARKAREPIQFTKVPVRTRAGSSPLRTLAPNAAPVPDGETSLIAGLPLPPRFNLEGRLRSGSIEALKQRARRDTITSSEMSSENEVDPHLHSQYPRRYMSSMQRVTKANQILTERIQEDEKETETMTTLEDTGGVLDGASSLSEGFVGSEELGSLLPITDSGAQPGNLLRPPIRIPKSASPRKLKWAETTLPKLLAPRPISVVPPVSALTLALKALSAKPENLLERFASLAGSGDANPLYIKIYAPASQRPSKPYELVIRRTTLQEGAVTVADCIGFALWRYMEEAIEPELSEEQQDVNRWNFRMVEDGEVEYDFPALFRTKHLVDFTSNNNRAARSRSREKPYDEFALVAASEAEYAQNKADAPEYSVRPVKKSGVALVTGAAAGENVASSRSNVGIPPESGKELVHSNNKASPVTATPFSAAPSAFASVSLVDNPNSKPSQGTHDPDDTITDTSLLPLTSQARGTTSRPGRPGLPRVLLVRYTDENGFDRTVPIEGTTDTYLAEVVTQACEIFRLDESQHFLRIGNSTTIAPNDRTIEALGEKLMLDLVRRRFAGDGSTMMPITRTATFGESPNAPIIPPAGGAGLGVGAGFGFYGGAGAVVGGTPKKGKRAVGMAMLSALSSSVIGQTQSATNVPGVRQTHNGSSLFLSTGAVGVLGSSVSMTAYKRYNVIRKTPMSFTTSWIRILALDTEYLHMMPSDKRQQQQQQQQPTTAASLLPQPNAGQALSQGQTHGQNPNSHQQPTSSSSKLITVPYSNIVGCKVSKRHPRVFRVVVFRERESKRYDFEAQSKEEAQEIVAEIQAGVEKYQTGLGPAMVYGGG